MNIKEIEGLVEKIANENGASAISVELRPAYHRQELEILIENADLTSASMELCAIVSRAVSNVLDELYGVDDKNPYDLIVSSAGIDRPLKKMADFERFSGEPVAITVKGENNRSEVLNGKLNVQDGDIYVDKIKVPFNNIRKANLDKIKDLMKKGAK